MTNFRLFLHKVKKTLKTRWIKSTYINLRLLPLRQAIKFPIIVTGKLKIRSLKGKVTLNCKPRFGLVNIGYDVDNMPIALTPAQLLIRGNLILNGDVILNQGANLVVWAHATMTLGNDVMICSGVVLKATNKVTIGNHVMISSGCFIMDSSIHCIYDTETLGVSAPFGEINIGDNVWLNMHTAVIKWGGVPNGCVTTRYTFIGKPVNIKDTHCLLSGQPAKVIKRSITQVHNFTTERSIDAYYSEKHSEIMLLNKTQVIPENLCEIIKR